MSIRPSDKIEDLSTICRLKKSCKQRIFSLIKGSKLSVFEICAFKGRSQKNGFIWERFGNTKGEIRVKKGGVLEGLDLVWESATPTTFGRNLPKKRSFFGWGGSPKHLWRFKTILPCYNIFGLCCVQKS